MQGQASKALFLSGKMETSTEGGKSVAKLVRACGGCLGTRRHKGAEDCDNSGEAVKRVLIPECPS
jgi:hypothetical protein